MHNPVPARYQDATGVWHTVEIAPIAQGGWQVTDVTASTRDVVDTLTGVGDDHDAAQAVARDYATRRHHPRRDNAA